MIRPLHVLDTGGFAGTEQHLLTLLQAQARLGQRPSVACRPGTLLFKGARASAGVSVVALPGTLGAPRAVLALLRAARGGAADVLHAHNGRSLLAGVIAGGAARLPVVMTQHFLEPNHTTQRGAKRALSNLAHRACAVRTSQVLAVSTAARDRMLARGEVSPDRVTVVPNGIAPPDAGGLRDAAAVRAEFGVADGAPLVVAANRLEAEKDVATLVAAMGAVRQACPSAVCVVAGEGSLRPALEGQIERHHLAAAVRLAGFRTDVLSLVRAADVFVLPSRAEPFGLVLLEAMALGRPVVATAAGGPLEIVVDGETGLLVPPGDPAAMGAAIVDLLGDGGRRDRLGRQGLSRFRAAFTDDRMAEATVEVYRRALGTAV